MYLQQLLILQFGHIQLYPKYAMYKHKLKLYHKHLYMYNIH